jgi:hypothetical protein
MHLYHIDAWNPIAWVQELMRQLTIIRQQQHPFGVHIQTTHRKETTGLRGYEIQYRGSSLLVVAGGDAASWFM